MHHREEEPGPKQNKTAYLFVSLYLVILAFFILLNSISKIQKEKSLEAIESLSNTFSDTKHDKLLPYIERSTSMGSQVAAQTYFSPVGKLAKEMLSLTDAQVIETGNTMVLKIPLSTFFTHNSPQIQAKQRAFMNTLADELTKMGTTADVNVAFNIGLLVGSRVGDPEKDADVELGVLRAGGFARVLASMGVDEKAIYVGLMPEADPNTLQMNFTVQNKNDKKVDPL